MNVNQRQKLSSYLKTIGKNIGDIQAEYCNRFVDTLLRTEVPYLVNFANNYRDFYLNHRLYHTQRGGAKFDTEEQKLYKLLIKLIGSTSSVNARPVVLNNIQSNLQDQEDIDRAYDDLKEMFFTMNLLFKNVKKVYEPVNTMALRKSSVLNGPSRYNFLKNISNGRRNTAKIELRGGKTRKQRR